jgi:hypothetical protein
MALYRYPQNDFDKANALLNVLGSFWATTYQGNSLVEELTKVTGQLAQQTYSQLLELINSVSRFNVPLYHQDNWYGIQIKESEINTDPTLLAKYRTPSPYIYSTPSELSYGVTQNAPYYSISKPKDLTDVKLIFNRLVDPSVQLTQGIDFWLEASVIVFRVNPFTNPLIARRDVLNNTGKIIDREMVLWLYRGKWDWDYVYEQFGYALQLRLQSSEGYKQFINAIFDAFCQGTAIRTQQLALAAAFGVPLTVETTETVETIIKDADKLNVITDQHVYQFPLTANPIVVVGQVVKAGAALTDLLQVFELNRGTPLSPTDVSALTVGSGVLAWGYWGDITFENKQTPTIVELNVDGYTKISWDLGGFPFDLEKFWEDVHAAGVAKGQTLAMLLDVRPNPIGQPTAASLPTSINPLQFLTDNLLRNNAYIVKVKPGSQLTNQLKFVPVAQLRSIQPPQSLMILIVELGYADAPVIMENPGTALAPGYEETFAGFPCMVIAETMNPSTYISERVRLSTIGGRCV